MSASEVMRDIRLLCADFDGVISNSLNECMLVAYNAYFGESFENIDKLPQSYRDAFHRTRYLVRDPGEYFLLVDSHAKGAALDDATFMQQIQARFAAISDFKPRFFAAREVLRSRDEQKWLRLHPSYAPFIEFLKSLEIPLYIVTTKDEGSVWLLLDDYGLADKVEDVFGQASLKLLGGKRGAILEACRRTGFTPAEAVFIDDHPLHLRDVEGCGVNLCYATWGYTPAGALVGALPKGAHTVALDDLRALLHVPERVRSWLP